MWQQRKMSKHEIFKKNNKKGKLISHCVFYIDMKIIT